MLPVLDQHIDYLRRYVARLLRKEANADQDKSVSQNSITAGSCQLMFADVSVIYLLHIAVGRRIRGLAYSRRFDGHSTTHECGGDARSATAMPEISSAEATLLYTICLLWSLPARGTAAFTRLVLAQTQPFFLIPLASGILVEITTSPFLQSGEVSAATTCACALILRLKRWTSNILDHSLSMYPATRPLGGLRVRISDPAHERRQHRLLPVAEQRVGNPRQVGQSCTHLDGPRMTDS